MVLYVNPIPAGRLSGVTRLDNLQVFIHGHDEEIIVWGERETNPMWIRAYESDIGVLQLVYASTDGWFPEFLLQ